MSSKPRPYALKKDPTSRIAARASQALIRKRYDDLQLAVPYLRRYQREDDLRWVLEEISTLEPLLSGPSTEDTAARQFYARDFILPKGTPAPQSQGSEYHFTHQTKSRSIKTVSGRAAVRKLQQDLQIHPSEKTDGRPARTYAGGPLPSVNLLYEHLLSQSSSLDSFRKEALRLLESGELLWVQHQGKITVLRAGKLIVIDSEKIQNEDIVQMKEESKSIAQQYIADPIYAAAAKAKDWSSFATTYLVDKAREFREYLKTFTPTVNVSMFGPTLDFPGVTGDIARIFFACIEGFLDGFLMSILMGQGLGPVYWAKLLASRGVVYATFVAAISIIAKQLTDVTMPNLPTHQVGDPKQQETIMSSILELLKVMLGGEVAYGDKPLLTKDRLLLVNQAFALAKNATVTFTVCFILLRYGINWIYEAIYGEPLFQSESDKHAASLRRVMTTINGLIPDDVPKAHLLNSLRVLTRSLTARLIEYQSCSEVDPKLAMQASKLLDAVQAYIASYSQASELADPRSMPTSILLFGRPGCGKTETLNSLPIVCGKQLEWEGDVSTWVHHMDPAITAFGSKPSPTAKFVIINEVFNSQDPKQNEISAQFILKSYGTTPLQVEGASLADKHDYLRPAVTAYSVNIMSQSKGILNYFALDRRLDGKFEVVCSSKGGQFDPKEEFPYPSLRYVSGDVKLTFPELCSWLIATIREKNQVNLKLLANRLGAAEQFKPVPYPDVPRPKKFTASHQTKITEAQFKKWALDDRGYTLEEANDRLSNVGNDGMLGDADLDPLLEEMNVENFEQLIAMMFPEKDSYRYKDQFKFRQLYEFTPVETDTFIAGAYPTFYSQVHDCLYCIHGNDRRFCLIHGHACPHPLDRSGESLVGLDIIRALWASGCRAFSTQTTLFLSTLRGLFPTMKILMATIGNWAVTLAPVALSVFAVGAAAFLLNQLIGPYFTRQYYSETSGVQRSDKITIPAASFSQHDVPGTANHQAGVESLKVAAKSSDNALGQRMNTVRHNQRAAVGLRGTKAIHFNLAGISGRIAITIAHSMDGLSHIAIEAPQKVVFKVADKPGFDPSNRTHIQYVLLPSRDLAFLIFPPGFAFRNMEKFLFRSNSIITQMWSNCLLSYLRGGKLEFELGDKPKIVSAENVEFVIQHYGDMQRYRNVTYTDGMTNTALIFAGGLPCYDGQCGAVVIPSCFSGDLQSHWYGIIHNGFHDPTSQATAVFCSAEDFGAFKAAFPEACDSPSAVHTVDVPLLTEMVGDFTRHTKISNLKIAGYVNTKSQLVPSPIRNCLEGMDLGVEPMPPTERVPALLYDIDRAQSKFSTFLDTPEEEDLAIFREALDLMATTALDCVKHAKLVDRFLTSAEAISGLPEYNIPPLDHSKSSGFVPTHPNLQRKGEFWHEVEPGVYDWLPEHAGPAEEIFQILLAGDIPMGYSKQSPKDENRPFAPITEEEERYLEASRRRFASGVHPVDYVLPKATRLVSCQDVYITVASRRILAPITAALCAGAPLNWTMLGVDPNSYTGHVFWNLLLSNNLFGIFLDISRFDTSQHLVVCNAVDQDYVVPIGTAVFSKENPRTLPRTLRAAAATRYLTFDLLGPSVYPHFQTMTSGSVATTMCNNPASGALVVGSAIIHCRQAGIQNLSHFIRTNLFGCTQGDDMAFSSTPLLPLFNQDVAQFAKKLNFNLTSASKDAIISRLDKPLFLKRVPHRMKNGLYCGRLLPAGIADQYSWVRVGTNTYKEGASINAEQALRELFYYGRPVFEEAKARLNNALFKAGCQPISLSYEEVESSSMLRYGITVSNISQRSPLTGAQHQSSVSNIKASGVDVATVSVGDADAREQAAPPLVRKEGLTVYADETVLLERHDRPMSKLHKLANPYSRSDIIPAICRPYQIANLDWSAAHASGTYLADYKALSVMAAFPQLRNRLTGLQYMRSGIKFMIKLNTTAFNSGRLKIAFIPFCTTVTDWRASFDVISNSEHYLLSASSSDALSLTYEWQHPNQWMRITDLNGDASLGLLVFYVEHPLQSASGSAPATVSLTITAQLHNPELAGPDTEETVPPLVGAKHQSAITEAAEKGRDGILTAVNLGTSTVGGVINSARNIVQPATSIVTDILGPIGGILKPWGQFAKDALGPIAKILPFLASRVTTVETTKVQVRRTFDNLTLTDGDDKSQRMALSIKSMVSMDHDIIGNDPMGDIASALQRPGLLEIGSISIAATSDQEITSFPVDPCYVRVVDADPKTRFVMTPLAWECQKAALWRGGLRYAFFFSASKFVTAKIGIFFVPSVSSPAPDTTNYADVYGQVFDVVGDTAIGFTIPFLYYQSWKETLEPSYAGLFPTGLIYVVLMNPISAAPGTTASPIYYSLYVAGDSDFQLAVPQRFCGKNLGGYSVEFEAPDPVFTKQTAVRELFAKQFPGLVDHSRGREEKVCVADELKTNVELLRRFELGVVLNSGAVQSFWNGQYFAKSGSLIGGDTAITALRQHAFLVLPYLIRRGGHRIKLWSFDTAGRITFFPTSAQGYSAGDFATGAAFCVSREVSGVEVDVPYYNYVPFMGVDFNPSPNNSLPSTQQNEEYIMTNNGASTVAYPLFAVSDDFGLGMYHAPPVLVGTIASVARRNGVYSAKAVLAAQALCKNKSILDLHGKLHPVKSSPSPSIAEVEKTPGHGPVKTVTSAKKQ